MKLRKDDPVFYKQEISKLIAQAEENGLEVSGKIPCGAEDVVLVQFKNDIGEVASVGVVRKQK